MLQQTQVAVVIPYFERWMSLFPSIACLAAAESDQVIKAWEGLGYYSRARNLHSAAKQIIERHGGELPQTEHELLLIKGLGPYTVGAIRAFAFKQKAAAVDGNVIRVLARHDLIEDDVSKSRIISQLRTRVLDILPDAEPWIVSEALIELGATVCSRKPQCSLCPLRGSCQAHAKDKAHTLPNKGKRVIVETLYRSVALIMSFDDQILVRRCAQSEIMQDLHEFPALALEHPTDEPTQLHAQWSEHWSQLGSPLALTFIRALAPVKHSYTRYRVTLFPKVFRSDSTPDIAGFFWTPIRRLPDLAFSSGHRQLLPNLLQDLE